MPDLEEKIEASPEEKAEIEEKEPESPEAPEVPEKETPEKPESEPEKEQHWDAEKAEAYFQTKYQEEKKRSTDLEDKLDALQQQYDPLLAKKETPKEEPSPKPPAIEIEEDGFDLETAQGQREYENRIVGSVSNRINQMLIDRDNAVKEQAKLEGYLKAEMEQSYSIFKGWITDHKVPQHIENAAVEMVMQDFPGARAPKIFKHAKLLIERAGGIESDKIRSARAAADAARKQKLLDKNKPPPEGVPPKPTPTEAKKVSGIIEEKFKPKEADKLL